MAAGASATGTQDSARGPPSAASSNAQAAAAASNPSCSRGGQRADSASSEITPPASATSIENAPGVPGAAGTPTMGPMASRVAFRTASDSPPSVGRSAFARMARAFQATMARRLSVISRRLSSVACASAARGEMWSPISSFRPPVTSASSGSSGEASTVSIRRCRWPA